MKKIILLLFVLSSMHSFAQKIELDKTTNGERFIITSSESIRNFTDKVPMTISLNCSINTNKEIFYSLSIGMTSGYSINVPSNGQLLIKTKNGEIINLKANNEFEDKIGKYNEYAKITLYTTTPSYNISPEQIELISSGVQKIRIETSLDPVDKEFKKDKIGSIISSEYKLINEALKQNKSLSDGF